ncbi:hypothetical protein BaRGS_00039618 [Batillaria attramentaria]|uniref:Uncharacterized protein n=1 Tax=Batillaria attramentaria TaxID=370345 RepID=A0ABD0J346_9CAEN
MTMNRPLSLSFSIEALMAPHPPHRLPPPLYYPPPYMLFPSTPLGPGLPLPHTADPRTLPAIQTFPHMSQVTSLSQMAPQMTCLAASQVTQMPQTTFPSGVSTTASSNPSSAGPLALLSPSNVSGYSLNSATVASKTRLDRQHADLSPVSKCAMLSSSQGANAISPSRDREGRQEFRNLALSFERGGSGTGGRNGSDSDRTHTRLFHPGFAGYHPSEGANGPPKDLSSRSSPADHARDLSLPGKPRNMDTSSYADRGMNEVI